MTNGSDRDNGARARRRFKGRCEAAGDQLEPPAANGGVAHLGMDAKEDWRALGKGTRKGSERPKIPGFCAFGTHGRTDSEHRH